MHIRYTKSKQLFILEKKEITQNNIHERCPYDLRSEKSKVSLGYPFRDRWDTGGEV